MRACNDAGIVFTVIVAGFMAFGACDKKKDAPTPAASASAAPACATCVLATEHGFIPSSLAIAKGGPGSKQSLTFTRTTDQTCARDAVFPELGLKVPLPLNEPVKIDVPADEARTLTFQCGMAMYKSSVVIQ